MLRFLLLAMCGLHRRVVWYTPHYTRLRHKPQRQNLADSAILPPGAFVKVHMLRKKRSAQTRHLSNVPWYGDMNIDDMSGVRTLIRSNSSLEIIWRVESFDI